MDLVGNNIETIINLEQFEELKALNLYGNPIKKIDKYTSPNRGKYLNLIFKALPEPVRKELL